MSHPTNADLWIGAEAEADNNIKTLFVDGASAGQIKSALDENPDVTRLYFGHEIDEDVIKFFENRINIMLEVASPDEVPADLQGRVEVILRVPNWIQGVKTRYGKDVETVSLDKSNYMARWNGQKAFEDDNVIE